MPYKNVKQQVEANKRYLQRKKTEREQSIQNLLGLKHASGTWLSALSMMNPSPEVMEQAVDYVKKINVVIDAALMAQGIEKEEVKPK